jgi:glucosamine--fructose-6-phosphate aminotransferase (isomerizing)
MCGIVGYVGKNQAVPVLLDGLSKLEYRGYDSAGVCVYTDNGVVVKKSKGRLNVLAEKIKEMGGIGGNIGIGHTRWATHGVPSDTNSHPHRYGKVTVVHNGIIENYIDLRSSLTALGEKFESETDTEVVSHLINYYYNGDPVVAISTALGRIRGSYALGIIFDDIPDKIYATRCDSPLIVGIGDGENYIASDIPAILNKTRKYYLIEQGEIAIVSENGIEICTFDKLPVKKEILEASWDIESAEKGGYEHFMLKEIYEQPDSLKATIEPRMINGIDNILKDEIIDTSSIKRIKIVACGSAMHAGLLGKNAIESMARIPVDVYIASEFRYQNPIFEEGSIVVVISQSGETADSLAALRLAKKEGIPTYAIVNVVGSSIAREADHVIYTWAGPEIAVATTKAYTAQVSVLYLLALRLSHDRKTLDSVYEKEIFSSLLNIPNEVKKLLGKIEHLQKLASLNSNINDMFFIGRGQDWALCQEGSLKLKEISYMHSEAYASGELKHGTISLITEGTPVVAVITERDIAEKTISGIKEVKARGAFVILIADEKCIPENADFCDEIVRLPRITKELMPLIAIIPLQLYAYYTAIYKGCDVDKPRNLAKSVTVE